MLDFVIHQQLVHVVELKEEFYKTLKMSVSPWLNYNQLAIED